VLEFLVFFSLADVGRWCRVGDLVLTFAPRKARQRKPSHRPGARAYAASEPPAIRC